MFRELKSGVYAYCAEGNVIEDGAFRVGTMALLASDLKVIASRGQSIAIAQFFGLVLPGLIMTRHVFRGLQRPLLTDGDNSADSVKLIYTRKPAFDYVWAGNPFDGQIKPVEPPQGAVFVVYVSPNGKHKDRFPQVDGWINYWTWIDEDKGLPEAPIDWVGRYDQKIWTGE